MKKMFKSYTLIWTILLIVFQVIAFFIPGWNDNINHFDEIANKLKNYKVIMIDLPNQGNSKPLNKKLEMNDYIMLIQSFLLKH